MRKILPGILLVVLFVIAALWLLPRIRMKKLTVVTIPGGAVVSINGVPSGLTPFTQFVPRSGVFVEVEKDGFSPLDSLTGSTPDTLFLQLREGCLLVVNTVPAGCQIISHEFSGVSPCSLFTESGYPVVVTALGEMGVSVTRTVNMLTPGARVITITVPFEFTDDTGMVFSVVSSDILPFAIGPLTVGRYEVTAEQFAEFMNSVDPGLLRDSSCALGRTCLMDSILKCNWRGPVVLNEDTTAYNPVPGMEQFPMTGVTQGGAVWFCEWLTSGSSAGLVFRLPRLEEWRALAESGSDLAVNLSDVNEVILARHPDVNDGFRETAPSGAMGSSSWGLCEMQGNVWEWTDCRGVATGGSWLSSIEDCTAESRIDLTESLGYPFVGFRVVATGLPEDIIPGSFNSEQEIDHE